MALPGNMSIVQAGGILITEMEGWEGTDTLPQGLSLVWYSPASAAELPKSNWEPDKLISNPLGSLINY